MKNTYLTFLAFAIILLLSTCQLNQQDEWIELFNGKDLTGWVAKENPGTLKVEDGAIVCNGERAHLYYNGEAQGAVF